MPPFGGFDAGSIVGHLILDKEQWRQAVNEARGDVKSLSKDVGLKTDEIQAAGRVLAGVGASITAVFGLMIKGAVDAGDEVNDLSKRTGIATELLSGYKLAADESGTSIEGFAVGMKGLANRMQEANDKGGAAKGLFQGIGVSVTDAAGKMRPLDAVLLDVADRFEAMPDGAEKSALAVDLFGKAGTELIPMLNLGRAGLEDLYREAERLGLVFSKDAAQGADAFNDSLVELAGAVKGAGNELVKALLPSLKPTVDGLKEIAAQSRAFVHNNPELSAQLAQLALGLGLVATALGGVCLLLPTFLKGWVALSPLLIAAGPAIVAIGTAFAGWKLGKWMGEIGGLNQIIQEQISSGKGLVAQWLIWARFMPDVNRGLEMGAGHAEAAARRTESLAAASRIAGRDIKDFREALAILRAEFAATGTVGNQWLDEWLRRLPPVKTGFDSLAPSVRAVFDAFKLKTRTELEADLKKAEEALATLRGSAEATPGAIKALEDQVKSLKTELYGTTTYIDTVGRKLQGLKEIFKDVTSAFTANIDRLAEELNRAEALAFHEMTPEEFSAATQEMLDAWAAQLGPRAGEELDVWSFLGMAPPQELVDKASQRAKETYQKMREGMIDPLKNAFSGLYNDIATGFAECFQGLVEGTKSFADFFVGIWESIKKAFFRILGEMVAGFMVNFIKKLIAGAKLLDALTGALGMGKLVGLGAGGAAAASAAGTAGGMMISNTGEIIAVSSTGAGAAISAAWAVPVAFAAVWLGTVFGTLFGKSAADKWDAEFTKQMQAKYGSNWRDFMEKTITSSGLKDPSPHTPPGPDYVPPKTIPGDSDVHRAGDINVTLNVSALDGANVVNVVRRHVIPILRQAAENKEFSMPMSAVRGM